MQSSASPKTHGAGLTPPCRRLKDILTPLQVLASDGVWEVMTAQEVVHFVQRWRKRPWQGWNASDALTLEAQERWKQLQEEVRPPTSPTHQSWHALAKLLCTLCGGSRQRHNPGQKTEKHAGHPWHSGHPCDRVSCSADNG